MSQKDTITNSLCVSMFYDISQIEAHPFPRHILVLQGLSMFMSPAVTIDESVLSVQKIEIQHFIQKVKSL